MTSQILPFILALAMTQTPALDSFSPQERREAIRSRAVLGNRDAVPALMESYDNEPRGDLRAEIVAALGRIRDRSAIPGLVRALQTDFRQEVRLQAIDSLLRLYIPIADEEGFFSFIGGVTRIFTEDERPRVGPNVVVDASVAEALVATIRTDFDRQVRREAVYALGSLAAVDQLPVLIEELEGPRHREDTEVRVAMVETMGTFRDQRAGPVLTRMIRDEDARIAEEAIRAVGLVGYREAYPVLSGRFRSESDDDVREDLLQSIALMRTPQAIPLFESLLDSDEAKYRELAAEGLARLDYDTSGFTARMNAERNASARLALAFALVASGETAHLQRLIDALDTRRSNQAEVYLYELGRFEGRLADIHPHLRNPDADIRERLLGILGRIGDPASRPYVDPLTDDRDADVAAAAVAALRQLTPR